MSHHVIFFFFYSWTFKLVRSSTPWVVQLWPHMVLWSW
jgi:hypothetical protein